MNEDFDLLPILEEEVEFCKRLQLKTTGIEIGVEVLHLLASRDLLLWQGETLFVYGLPAKVTNQNPWTVRFERHEQINR